MTIRIVNNKKIELTEDEWGMYNSICRSYDQPNRRGEDLFVDLFESDNNGLITFIRPPGAVHTSMEAYLFMCSIFQHQNVRLMQRKVDRLCAKVEERLKLLEEKSKQA